MDEWVGAGDAEFMAKATERMKSHMGGSNIVVLASHSVGLLRDVCNKGIVLEGGRVVHAGGIADALRYYHELMARLRMGHEAIVDESADAEAGHVFGAVEEVSSAAGSGSPASSRAATPRAAACIRSAARSNASPTSSAGSATNWPTAPRSRTTGTTSRP